MRSKGGCQEKIGKAEPIERIGPFLCANTLDKRCEKYGIVGWTTNGLRLCSHIDNAEKHYERAVSGMKGALATSG